MTKIVNATSARQFVSELDMHGLDAIVTLEEDQGEPIYKQAQNQALIVGSGVVSFVKGVPADFRQDIAKSALLAQLVAKKKVPDLSDSTKMLDWYREYFAVLCNVGWVLQDEDFVEFDASSKDADVHKAALELATSLLGGATTAFLIVKAALDALKSASDNNPWITLFSKETQQARSAKFQITSADEPKKKESMVSLMAFALEAETTITQVLLFKFKSSRATMKKYSGAISIDTDVLAAVREQIKDKINNFVAGFIKELPNLG